MRIFKLLLPLLAVVLMAPAVAPGAPRPYQADDATGFRDILPPGTNGLANASQLGTFLSSGERPAHNNDQLAMYGDLVFASPGLKAQDLPKYFKDASFGVKPGDLEREYSPRPDVTVQRDKSFGVPHVYGTTRAGTMFGLGYVAAEDRLFFIDVLRNAGRARLSSFAGGAEGNRKMDRDQWAFSPYTEADLQRQVDQFDDLYGAEGRKLQQDLAAYVEGVNAYINEAKLNPLKLPGEYAAIGQPLGPEPWKATDTVAVATLVGGIFGKGGGNEVQSAQVLQGFQARFGRRAGRRAWADFRSQEDPEAPTTVLGKRFPYRAAPRRPRGVAIPDAGSYEAAKVSADGGALGAAASSKRPGAGGLLGASLRDAFPSGMSNALVVSGRESASGNPLAVFGPQVSYFSPQILMEQDAHGPGIDARGASFPGTNLYVQLGRGRDYAWSATSAGQDIVDQFALPVCGDGNSYVFRGACEPIEFLERTNTWKPNLADDTPPGSETLRTGRTKLGIVIGRGRIKGREYLYTSLRSTYMHEVDSAIGFSRFNDPAAITGPRAFQDAAYRIGYAFNWLYVDSKSTAYFNSGNNPVRAARTDPNFPVLGERRFEWRDYNPVDNTATYTPFSAHPQVIDQPYLVSWNNKQAPAYRASDNRYNYGPVDRSQPLEDRIKRGIAGKRKMTLVQLVDAMEDAGTVDLRGAKVLPWMLRVVGRPKDAASRAAIAELRGWIRRGAHRRDLNRDGAYDDARAVQIMDAWWPRAVKAQFEKVLGKPLYDRLMGIQGLDNAPNNKGAHMGSAYDDGWFGFVQKDLRMLVGAKVKGRWSRTYCGGRGKLRGCRTALRRSLVAALKVPREELYRDAGCAAGDQVCFDQVRFRALGGITQPPINWINRPTYQQVVEIPRRLPR